MRTALNGHVDGGRLLQGPGDTLLSVISVELDRSPRQVYNFEVDGLHSYAAGPLGEWVHNGRLFRGKKRKTVMEKNDGKCVRCGAPAQQADHIVPHCKDGPTEVGNGQPLCATCNNIKSGSDPIPGLDLPSTFK